ncbi:MAG: hypothetical protein QW594_04135, partial [Candidatus Woesearchaeota archaeon]
KKSVSAMCSYQNNASSKRIASASIASAEGFPTLQAFLDELGIVSIHMQGVITQHKGDFLLLSQELLDWTAAKPQLKEYYFAGELLGTSMHQSFLPSIGLLLRTYLTSPYQTILNDHAAWLFTCGRDIFSDGILQSSCSPKGYSFIVDMQRRCLGLGKKKILHPGSVQGSNTPLQEKEKRREQQSKVLNQPSITFLRVMDIGDFLRRERALLEKQKSKKHLTNTSHKK